MTSKSSLILAFFILAFLFLSHFLGWLIWPEKLLTQLAGNISGGIYAINRGTEGTFERWAGMRTAFNDKLQCENKLAQANADQAELKQLRNENDFLRNQLGFLKNKKKYILANVVGKENELANNILIINKGSDQGISVGKPILAGEGILVGKIIKVNSNTSLVRLLTDSQSKIGATALNKDETIGVVVGEYNLSLKLIMVPLTEVINPGDQIITSGLEKDLPRGLLIGQIENVQKELYQPFQVASLKTGVDLNKLSIVSVLIE